MSQLDVKEAFHIRNTHWVPVPESGSCPASHPTRLQSPEGQSRCYTNGAADALRRTRESYTEFEEQERPPLKTQTYILSKERFKTQAEADKWMDDNNAPRPKVDEKENTFRYRQFDPDRCEEGSARTLRITDGVQIVGCRLKPEFREEVTSFKDLPLAERTRAWDSGEAVARVRRWASVDDKIDFDRYSMAFVVVDGPKENLTSYKLPFADFFDGRLRAVPRGIFAAAGVLGGARGGIDLPSGDLTRAQNHLGQYYSKMELRPPWAPRESTSDQAGMHETGIDFGAWLKNQREKLGIDMAELARRSGMSSSMISTLEKGEVMRPGEDCLRAWAKFFGVSYEFLRDMRNKGLETGLLEEDILALNYAIREQAEKLTNERARLREADADNPTERCKFCAYFEDPSTCRIIDGPVAADQVCDWIFSRETEAGLYEIADEDWLAFVVGMIKKQPYQHIVRDGAITPEGPVVMIEDTAEPPHRFSLTKKFHVEHTCVDEKTRAVTPDGLKSYEDLQIGDSVFCLDKRTGMLTTAPVKQIMTHPHDGKLIHWKGDRYNFAVTPNHRIYCHLGGDHGAAEQRIEIVDQVRSMVGAGSTYQEITRRVGVSPATISRWRYGLGDVRARRVQETKVDAFDVVEAKDLRRRHQFFLPAPTGYKEKSLHPIRLPKKSGSGSLAEEIPVDLFMRLAGWYVSEGWSSVKYGIFGLAGKKEGQVREIDSLVAQLGCHYRYSHYQFIIYRVILARLFGKLFGTCAPEKRVPAFIKNAPRENLWTFLLCYLRGDGTLLDTGSWTATTVSPRLRDDLVEIAWKLGFAPGVWTRSARRHFVIRKYYDCKEAYTISAAPTLRLPRGTGYSVTNISGRNRRWSYLKHKGTVWCPVVEEHENWLAERDGKYVFTGNSLEHHWTQAEVDDLVSVGRSTESVQQESFRIDLKYVPEKEPTHEELEGKRQEIMKKFEDFVKAEFPKGDIKVELENLIPKEMQEQDVRNARFFLFDIHVQEVLPDGRRGPSFKTLRDSQVRLSDNEKEIAMKAEAVWHHGPNSEATCAIWKSVVRGETWYVCNTHRAFNVRPTLKAAIKQFHEVIKLTAGLGVPGPLQPES